jgi:hypothetical protein
MLHKRENKETCEAYFIKLTPYEVGGMWIYNTDICGTPAEETKNTKMLSYIQKKIKKTYEANFFKLTRSQ